MIRARSNGFATATVLGLLAVIALLSAAALHDALFGELQAGSRVLQQRAMTLAQVGLQEAMRRLDAPAAPSTTQFAMQPLADSEDTIAVTLRSTGSSALPGGFSAGRFMVQHYEMESTAHVARGTRMTLKQGATRVVPAAAPAAPFSAPSEGA